MLRRANSLFIRMSNIDKLSQAEKEETDQPTKGCEAKAKFEQDFVLLASSKYWPSFISELSSLVSMYANNREKLKETRAEIFITEKKLISYTILWTLRDYTEAYMALIECIQAIWKQFLASALIKCKDAEDYKIIVDTLLQAILDTYNSHKLEVIQTAHSDTLALEQLPLAISNGLSDNEQKAYVESIAELKKLIQSAREKKLQSSAPNLHFDKSTTTAPGSITNPKEESDVNQLPEQCSGNEEHFVYFTALSKKFYNHIKVEKGFKAEDQTNDTLEKIANLLAGVADTLDKYAREGKYEDILPVKISKDSKANSCFFSIDYLDALFRIMFEKFIKYKHHQGKQEISIYLPKIRLFNNPYEPVVNDWLKHVRKIKASNLHRSQSLTTMDNPLYGQSTLISTPFTPKG